MRELTAVPTTAFAPSVLVDERHDQAIRWAAGERLHDIFAAAATAFATRAAFDTGSTIVTFAELDGLGRRIAGELVARGLEPGGRVALVFDDPVSAYATMLAVSRVGGVYVPLDPAFPAERLAWICADADVQLVMTTAALADGLRRALPGVETAVAGAGAGPSADVSSAGSATASADAPAYIVYTSGTTGRPKGVVVEHSALCNFVRVAAEVYGYRAGDRVYQGLTIAFDFSVEESWVPWVCGATAVPRPPGPALLGDELADFVRGRRVTALCCVPTLLATVDDAGLDALRLLIVSGEACPAELVTRWHRTGRRILNVYGPTEATVSCTWTVLRPDRPVTLGVPLPTYRIVLLDRESDRPVAHGDEGEIGVAGPGLAVGYLGRPELTDAAFVADVLDLPGNPSGRIYRTGDLGRVDDGGEIVYLGRKDTQVKIRGYRIELGEIESVLLGIPGVRQAAVVTWEPAAGQVELVAYYSADPGAVVEDAVRGVFADRLPSYMVPAYLMRLDVLPMTTSNKIDVRALPRPRTRGVAAAGAAVSPGTAAEDGIAHIVAEVLALPEVSVVDDFFDQLGANSLLMAQICAKARAAGFGIGIRDCYEARTVRSLAARAGGTSARVVPAAPGAARTGYAPASSAAFVATGVAQAVLVFCYLWAIVAVGDAADAAFRGPLGVLGVGVASLAAACLLPVAVKWLVAGRVRETTFPLWGVAHLRFWVVRTVVRSSPLVLLVGTPAFNVYLRLLGARVGPGALLLSRRVLGCPDLLDVGADAVIRRDAIVQCYEAGHGAIRTGRVRIGAGAFVGESSVVGPGCELGVDAQLAPSSSLDAGQVVPDHDVWFGVPGRPAPTGSDFRRMATSTSRRRSVLRRTAVLPAVVVGAVIAGALVAGEVVVLDDGGSVAVLLARVAVASVALVLAAVVSGAIVALAGRCAGRLLRPGVLHRVGGRQWLLLRFVEAASNRPFLVSLFGDSVAITGWMRFVGWRLGRVDQTGSNFGTTHRHQVPGLTAVGSGTMVSDGLSVANADISSTHFRVRDARIGSRNFLGNKIVYPSGARVGDDVLLATKVLVPTEGAVHEGVGLLGSPAFVIPRSVARDARLVPDQRTRARALRAKTRYNVASMVALLAARCTEIFVVLLPASFAFAHVHLIGSAGVAGMLLASIVVAALWAAVVERAFVPGRRLREQECSIYAPYFWRHERLWKLLTPAMAAFDGTPFKGTLLRVLGVRVGARLFDDGAAMPEHTLVAIGADCVLNAGATLQGHSLEDGAFKSGSILLGDDVTVGVAGFVHYGTDLGDHATVGADAFVMKGSVVMAGSSWTGNPAVPEN